MPDSALLEALAQKNRRDQKKEKHPLNFKDLDENPKNPQKNRYAVRYAVRYVVRYAVRCAVRYAKLGIINLGESYLVTRILKGGNQLLVAKSISM